MKLDSKRWLLLLAAIITNVCIGSGYAWSVFAKPLIALFSWSPADVAFTFTLCMGISPLPMIIVGKIQQYVSTKKVMLFSSILYGLGVFASGYVNSVSQIHLTFGIIAGMGFGAIYAVNVGTMMRFFPDKRGLCSGLLAAGFGSGALVVAPIASRLIIQFGVLSALKILGIAFTVICVAMSLVLETAPAGYKPEGWTPPKQSALNNTVDKDWKQMLQDPMFYIIAAIFVCGTLAGLMIIALASPIFQDVTKLSAAVAAIYVGVLSIFNTCGRIIWGAISDKIGRLNTITIMYIIAALAAFGLTKTSGYLFITMVMAIAFCFGGFMAMLASYTADAFGVKNLPINFGIMFLAFSIAAYLGPRIAVSLRMSNDGSYSEAFLVASIINAAGIIIALIAKKYIATRNTSVAQELTTEAK